MKILRRKIKSFFTTFEPLLENQPMIFSTQIELGGGNRLCTLKEGFDRNLVSDGLFFQLGVPLEVERPKIRGPTVNGPNGELLFSIGWAELSFKLKNVWVKGKFEVVCMVNMNPVVNFDVVVSRRLIPAQMPIQWRDNKLAREQCRFCRANHDSAMHHRLISEKNRVKKIKTLLKL